MPEPVDPQQALERLRAAAASGELDAICERWGVRVLGAFGSTPRRLRHPDDPPPRDLDVSVSFAGPPHVLELLDELFESEEVKVHFLARMTVLGFAPDQFGQGWICLFRILRAEAPICVGGSQQLAEGLPNKAIADRLGISDQTVKFHIASIAGKLGAANRTDAVRRAVRRGLITL